MSENKKTKLIRLRTDAKQDKFNSFSKRVHTGELEWVYYAIDGNFGYHYFRKLT